MRLVSFIIICFCGIAFGFFYFAIHQEWIIFQRPSYVQLSSENSVRSISTKRSIDAWFWDHGIWKKEPVIVLWSDNIPTTLRHIITSWLTVLEDTGHMPKKVGLEAVMATSSDAEIFISFTRNPFGKEEPTIEKWMRLEGLLKTIRQTGLPVERIRFLVHHQSIQDQHLDLTVSWPIQGYSPSE